jgi:hypothetical protein
MRTGASSLGRAHTGRVRRFLSAAEVADLADLLEDAWRRIGASTPPWPETVT